MCIITKIKGLDHFKELDQSGFGIYDPLDILTNIPATGEKTNTTKGKTAKIRPVIVPFDPFFLA